VTAHQTFRTKVLIKQLTANSSRHFGLSPPQDRSYLAIAAAIVTAGVLISASLFIAVWGAKTTTVTKTVTSTSTCVEGGSNATNAFTTDCKLGVTLGLAVGPIIPVGQNETIRVSLTNDLASPENVTYTGIPTLHDFPGLTSIAAVDFVLPESETCGFPSSPGYLPAFIVVYDSSGAPLQLGDSIPILLTCLSSNPSFHPFNASQTISETISIGGYWTSPNPSEPWVNATYHQFPPGSYTIAAFDPWDQIAEQNFTVNFSDSYIYLSAGGFCSGPGGYEPCWGGTDAYVFDCASSAATPEGCTQIVTSTLAPYPSYTIDIRYPFTNQTTPSWANCLWTVAGVTPGQGYAYCISVNSTSFVIGEQAGPHL
jgi:hypothetical protein